MLDFVGMKWTAAVLVTSTLVLFGQQPRVLQRLPTFSYQKHLVDTPSDHSAIADNRVLLREIAKRFDGDEFAAASVQLGALGSGAIVNGSSINRCGATGNCEMSVYYLDGGHYRSADLGVGWAYAVTNKKPGVPEVVVMQNLSYQSGTVRQYSFIKGKFETTGCDYVELRHANGDIRDPKQVAVHPC